MTLSGWRSVRAGIAPGKKLAIFPACRQAGSAQKYYANFLMGAV
jgi:hypothetical protein